VYLENCRFTDSLGQEKNRSADKLHWCI